MAGLDQDGPGSEMWRETARLAALDSYGILDTAAEPGFDDIVLLASLVCDTSVALISLVAAGRQWFKARIGFDACETPLAQSVCAHTLRQPGLLVIPDLRADPRTDVNTLVTGPPHLRFYAGARLQTSEGQAIGALCVIDTQPRPAGLTSLQAQALEALARQVMAQLELRRRSMATLEIRVAEQVRNETRTWQVSTDLLGILNTDAVFERTNPAWQAVLGWSADEIASRPFFDFLHPDDLAKTQATWNGTRRGSPVLDFENRYRCKDDTYRWLSWVAVPEGSKVYCSARDVTAQKEAQAELARAQDALRQSQKMEAVGQLTGGLAHDFNNLLTGIIGSLELLDARIAQRRLADAGRYVAAAQGAAKRAAALTQRLLAFSRRQTLDPRSTDVSRLAAGMEELVQRTVGPAIAVELAAADGLWTTLIDAGQLENALLNLCINARDAMPEGGRLVIETGNVSLDGPAAREQDVAPGQFVTLRVSDTGTGMPPEVAARAFDPFFTTKPLGMGTGLGLSMVYGFVRQSGGQARIQSEPGSGTAVSLYLPRFEGRADVAVAAAAPSSFSQGRGEAVLVVDDEPTVRTLVAEVLEERGYAVAEAGDGRTALAMLRSTMKVDLLVTDVGLPGGMNGRQLADAARVLRPGLRVLFVTGYAEHDVLNHGHLEPGMRIVTKPFATDALAGHVRDLLASAAR